MSALEIITASAGTGKTYRLTDIMAEHLLAEDPARRARPEGIVAITYTRKAAAELQSRLRRRLMDASAFAEADRIRDGYLGTIHAVCQRLLVEFALEGGLSPDLQPMDEAAGERLFREAMAPLLGPDGDGDAVRGGLDEAAQRLGVEDWRKTAQEIVRHARDNGLGAAELHASAERSLAGFLALLPDPVGDAAGRDAEILAELEALRPVMEARTGESKAAAKRAEVVARTLAAGRQHGAVPWLALVQTRKELSGKRLQPLVGRLVDAIDRHLDHPRLRAEVETVVRGVFRVAAEVLEAYAERKRAARVVDYADMLALAHELLKHAEVAEALAARFDVVLVDEFQDVSPLQLAIVTRLASLARLHAAWVGDPKQAIYGFQGSDPELMEAAVAATLVTRRPTVLDVSYRSRPGLVRFCSDVFVRALEAHAFPPEQVRLTAHQTDPEALVATAEVECWRFTSEEVEVAPGAVRRTTAFDGVAGGVEQLLAEGGLVRIRGGGAAGEPPLRRVQRRDIGVLARTNKSCRAIAAALEIRGIPASVALDGLFQTAEAVLVRAGLALVVDPRDGVAAAEVSWLAGALGADPDAWLARRLGDMEAWRAASDDDDARVPRPLPAADEAAVAAVRRLHDEAAALSPTEALEGVLAALDAAEVCRSWPQPRQRLANLEALRAHAADYEDLCRVHRRPATVAGLVAHFERLAAQATKDEGRQALPSDPDAVQVATWHAAKGLEWPVVVLTDLDDAGRDWVFGLAVEPSDAGFDATRPLDGRWIRWWPYPYRGQRSDIPLIDRASGTAEAERSRRRDERERARLLYVGLTRARDRVVLFATMGRDGAQTTWLDELRMPDESSVLDLPWTEEPGLREAYVGGAEGDRHRCVVRAVTGAPGGPRSVAEARAWLVRREAPPRPAETVSPSSIVLPEALGAAVTVEAAVAFAARPRLSASTEQMTEVGLAIHAFLASDLVGEAPSQAERLARATQLLAAHGVGGAVDPEQILALAASFRRHLEERFHPRALHAEWPVRWATRVADQPRLLVGEADLVLELDAGLVVIDHKAFPGDAQERDRRARAHAGQLAAYRAALEQATGRAVLSTHIHFPLRGELVEVRVGGLGLAGWLA